MRFGEPWEDKKLRLVEWHSFFALFPTQMRDGSWAWLEIVQRRGKPPIYWCLLDQVFCFGWEFEYRHIGDN